MTAGETRQRIPWYRIENKADKVSDLYIFDVIDPMWGTGAQALVAELNSMDASQINVHINSPGGNVFDGIAILNALRAHPARITATVDGLAASIASVIAMAGEEIVMSLGAQMMIHDASGAAIGNSETMQELAAVLEKSSNSIASIYASRAGGTAEDWRTAMKAETWYTAQEAVDAGLADRLDDTPAEVTNRFDLSIFNHAGREAAPSPFMPRPKAPVTAVEAMRRIHNASVKEADTHLEGDVQFSDEQLAALRTKLGLADDAPLEPSQVLAAISDPGPAPQDNKKDPEPVTPTAPVKQVAGTMVIDASAWDEREERIKRLEASQAKHAREERDQVIDQAVKDGKFSPARKEHWAKYWDADPEGARQSIDGLMKNVIPVEAVGFGVEDAESIDAEFASLFPPTPKGA